jgi:cytochrome c
MLGSKCKLAAGFWLASFIVAFTPAFAADAVFGQRLFDRCVPCHTVQQGGRHSLGPNLFGVVGRAAGGAAGYNYSPAMANSDITWTPENLARFLQDTDGSAADSLIPGNRMLQLSVPTDDQIADIVAYLGTLR